MASTDPSTSPKQQLRIKTRYCTLEQARLGHCAKHSQSIFQKLTITNSLKFSKHHYKKEESIDNWYENSLCKATVTYWPNIEQRQHHSIFVSCIFQCKIMNKIISFSIQFSGRFSSGKFLVIQFPILFRQSHFT